MTGRARGDGQKEFTSTLRFAETRPAEVRGCRYRFRRSACHRDCFGCHQTAIGLQPHDPARAIVAAEQWKPRSKVVSKKPLPADTPAKADDCTGGEAAAQKPRARRKRPQRANLISRLRSQCRLVLGLICSSDTKTLVFNSKNSCLKRPTTGAHTPALVKLRPSATALRRWTHGPEADRRRAIGADVLQARP